MTAGCREAALYPAQLTFPAELFPAGQLPDVGSPGIPESTAPSTSWATARRSSRPATGISAIRRYLDELATLDSLAPATAAHARWRDLNGNRNLDNGEVNLDPRAGLHHPVASSSAASDRDLIEPTRRNEYMGSRRARG